LIKWVDLSLLGIWLVMMVDVVVQFIIFVKLHLKGDWLKREV